mmetsp:Transcript_905/g.3595  ORF Transcript_905/g.3595 Transcript_905/m.3595 type:complete len:198 (+) Transcript_905:3-596(+)
MPTTVAALLYSRVLAAYRPAVDACTQVWAKPLHDGVGVDPTDAGAALGSPVAIVAVNFDPAEDRTVSCDARCLATAAGLSRCARGPDASGDDEVSLVVGRILTRPGDDDAAAGSSDDDDPVAARWRRCVAAFEADPAAFAEATTRVEAYRVRDLHAHAERDLAAGQDLAVQLRADGDAAAFTVRPLRPLETNALAGA